jgi:stage V sporulation protein S
VTYTQHSGVTRVGEQIELRVAGRSEASRVAGAIAKYFQEGGEVYLSAIGAGAVNQAVKSICLARGMLIQSGIDIYCIPLFSDERVNGEHRTGIKIRIFQRGMER